ncbi:MAG: hypothetical protein PUB22_07595 [Clostridiales bacterium]|nr:hypothetical protein [Clostridiales bacterium]
MARKDAKICLALYVLMSIALILPVLFVDMPVVVDEMGTTANAAYLAGYDWHNGLICSGGFYYKYGQVLIWTLPFLLIRDSVILYRVLLIISSLLMSSGIVCCYVICRKFFHIPSERQAAALSAASTLVPSVLMGALYTRADSMLCTLTWMLLLLMLVTAGTESPKLRFWGSVLVGILSVYSFMCHTRGIVTVLAVFFTLFLGSLFCRRSLVSWPAYLVSTGISLAADRMIAEWFRLGIWGENGAVFSAAETFDWASLMEIFTPEGMRIVLDTVLGWLYILFCSTYGLAAVALVGCILLFWKQLRKKWKENTEWNLTSLFGFFLFGGNLAMGVLFFFPYIRETVTGTAFKRADRLIYDRYLLPAMGILVLMGLLFLIYQKKLYNGAAKAVTAALSALVIGGFALLAAPALVGHQVVLRYFSVPASFLTFYKGEGSIVFREYPTRLVLVGCLCFVLFLVILALSLARKEKIMMAVILTTGMALYGVGAKRLRIDEGAKRSNRSETVREFMEEVCDLPEQYRRVYVKTETLKVKYWQFPLKEYRMINRNKVKLKKKNNLFVLYDELPQPDSLAAGKYYTIDSLPEDQDNNTDVLVKGKKLAKELKKRGYKLTLYANVKKQEVSTISEP